MVKLLFFSFQVNNSKLKNKQFHFELLTRWVNFYFFHYRVVNVDLANEKNLFKYYSSNVRKPLEIDITPLLRFLRTPYDSMSWGCQGMLKSRSGIDVVSIRWESLRSLFRGYILLGARDIQVQSFNYLTSSYLQWCAWSQHHPF